MLTFARPPDWQNILVQGFDTHEGFVKGAERLPSCDHPWAHCKMPDSVIVMKELPLRAISPLREGAPARRPVGENAGGNGTRTAKPAGSLSQLR